MQTGWQCPNKVNGQRTKRFVTRLYQMYANMVLALEGQGDASENAHGISLLLHRLLFLYFLQQSGLLANDTRYLQHRLAQNIDECGYYRDVLSPLFTKRESLDECPGCLSNVFLQPIQPTLALPNKYFAQLFALFDEYCRPLGPTHTPTDMAVGLEIFDMLFAQGMSQKDFGAYYTPSEITTYITRNTVLPALFTRTIARCQQAGIPLPATWRLPQPVRYLSVAARQGYEYPLPPEIAAGLHDVSQRHIWQEMSIAPYALPGETWREVLARRAYVHDVMASDVSDTLNRSVTWNLDQHMLALDTLATCQQPAFLAAFYQSLRNLTVLDPTCGSGAFLSAALAQLAPLYLASLARMEELLAVKHADAHRLHAYVEEAGEPAQRPATVVRWVLEHNLYGVDLMPDAVERCRQRLLLHLLAAKPDLPTQPAHCTTQWSQHMRVGNSLTGSLDVSPVTGPPGAFHWNQEFPEINNRGGFDAVIGNPPYVEYEQARSHSAVEGYATLGTGNLYALTMERSLHLLAPEGRLGMIVPASATCTNGYRVLQQQLLSQQELHIASFSDQRGRLFDIPHPRLCIIFCEKSLPTQMQPCRVFTTPYIKLERAHRPNLFACLHYTEVTQQVGPGVIPRYGSVLEHSIQAKLHNQARHLGAFLTPAGEHTLYFTRKLSWFVQVTPFIPLILNEYGQTRTPSELKTLRFSSSAHAQIAFVVLNSNLFYWLITTQSDCRNLNSREVLGLPLDLASISPTLQAALCQLAEKLAQEMLVHAQMKPMVFQGKKRLIVQCMHPAYSKYLIDEVDCMLAQHYGFDEHELDFLLHYDSKYRGVSPKCTKQALSLATTLDAGFVAGSPSRR